LACHHALQTNHHFIKAVVPHLVPVLLKQLTKQEEGQEQDDTAWNLAMASGTCLGLLARTAEVRLACALCCGCSGYALQQQ
jgi:hypothetical protein